MRYSRYPDYAWPSPHYPPYPHCFYGPWGYPLPLDNVEQGARAPLVRHAYSGPGYGHHIPLYVAPPSHVPGHGVELIPLLGGLYRPTLIWDVAQEVTSAQRVRSTGEVVPVTPSLLDEPATFPPIQRMRVLSDAFPWDIDIKIPPPEARAGQVVTVKIVLECIYALLHEDLSEEDWRDKDHATQRRMRTAMLGRLRRAPPSLMPGGMLKIDSLLDRTEFLGLRLAGSSEDVWSLSLGVPRR